MRFHCLTTFRSIAPSAKTLPLTKALLFVTAVAVVTTHNFFGARPESRQVLQVPATSSATTVAVMPYQPGRQRSNP